MKESIKKVSRLARLKFPESEMGRFVAKAQAVLKFVEQLKELDTSKIEATSHAIEVVNAFREDSVQKFEKPNKILEISPSRLENLFEVPKVIE